MLEISFHNLVAAGMNHLKYFKVLNLTGDKDILLTLEEPLVTLLG